MPGGVAGQTSFVIPLHSAKSRWREQDADRLCASITVPCWRVWCVVRTQAHANPALFRGAVLLAPMLSLERVAKAGLNPYLRPLTAIADYLAPSACLAATAENTVMPHLQAIYDRDELCWHKWTRVRSARHYLAATERIGRLAPEMRFPFLTFHSARDTMVEPESSQRLFERTAADVDKEFVRVDHMCGVSPSFSSLASRTLRSPTFGSVVVSPLLLCNALSLDACLRHHFHSPTLRLGFPPMPAHTRSGLPKPLLTPTPSGIERRRWHALIPEDDDRAVLRAAIAWMEKRL